MSTIFMFLLLGFQVALGIYWIFFRFSNERRYYANKPMKTWRPEDDER